MTSKAIYISQRIPLDTLHVALVSYLDNNYSEEYITEQLRLAFKGENRLKKAVTIVNKIVPLNPIISLIHQDKNLVLQALKIKNDRNIILIALLNSSFNFAFDTLQSFGKFLSVQNMVNKDTIKKSLTNIYGSNRSTENAFNCVVPMFIEAGFILRPSPAIYKSNPHLSLTSTISKKIYIESFRSNQQMKDLHDYQFRNPYFFFLDYLSDG